MFSDKDKTNDHHQRLPAFEKFIQDVRAAWAELPDTEKRMKRVKVLLEGLVQDSTIREHSKHWPSTEGHKNCCCMKIRIISSWSTRSMRTPGRDGRIHDHAHAWTAYGVLDGTERLERYRRVDQGKKPDTRCSSESLTEGYPGKVDLVPPFAIHSEKVVRQGRSE